MTWPEIAIGSIVKITVQSQELPAIVLSQNAEDGSLALFCFHFEGQFLQSAWPVLSRRQQKYVDETGSQQIAVVQEPNVTVLFDASLWGSVPIFTDIVKRITALENQLRELDAPLPPPVIERSVEEKPHGKVFKAG